MNEPQVLVTNKANPTGVWIDLVKCCDFADFDAEVVSQLNIQYDDTEGYVVSESDDLPKCYIQDGELHPYAFEFAKKDEEERTIIFAYSTISTDIANWLAENALSAWHSTHPDLVSFVKSRVEQQEIVVSHLIADCIDYDKLAVKLEEFYIFVDIASKTYVFNR